MTNLQVVFSPFPGDISKLLSYSFFQMNTGDGSRPRNLRRRGMAAGKPLCKQTSESSWKNVEDQDGFLWDFPGVSCNEKVESDCNFWKLLMISSQSYVLSFSCMPWPSFCQSRFFATWSESTQSDSLLFLQNTLMVPMLPSHTSYQEYGWSTVDVYIIFHQFSELLKVPLLFMSSEWPNMPMCFQFLFGSLTKMLPVFL